MNIDKTKVYIIGVGMLIAAGILSAGPRATSASLELSMFHIKMAVVCLVIGFCLKSEKKR
jgi:hypothetical protein